MAIPVARVHLAVAHAALPALLPTPPKSKMLPLLAAPCVLILPMSPPNKPTMSAPKASRADADQRWDVSKSATKSPSKPGRADAVERWDAHKISPASRPSSPCSSQRSSDSRSSSSRRASSPERWDANKTGSPPSSSNSRASPSAARWDSNKRAFSHASSAKRSDAHKKPRPPLADDLDGGDSSTGSNDMELDMPKAQQQAMYAGPCFFASPDPSMLSMPKFLVRAAA